VSVPMSSAVFKLGGVPGARCAALPMRL